MMALMFPSRRWASLLNQPAQNAGTQASRVGLVSALDV